MNIKSIEQRIIERTDVETKRQVDEAIDKITKMISADFFHKKYEGEAKSYGEAHKVSLPFAGAIYTILKDLMMYTMIQRNREQAIRDFMEKVDRVHSACESLEVYLKQEEN